MRTFFACLATAAILLGTVSLPVLAQDPRDKHPTITAVNRYGHRKVVHAANAANKAVAHAKNYPHRKAHQFRSYLNNH